MSVSRGLFRSAIIAFFIVCEKGLFYGRFSISANSSTIISSVVRHPDVTLSNAALARRTFSKIVLALAVQTKP